MSILLLFPFVGQNSKQHTGIVALPLIDAARHSPSPSPCPFPFHGFGWLWCPHTHFGTPFGFWSLWWFASGVARLMVWYSLIPHSTLCAHLLPSLPAFSLLLTRRAVGTFLPLAFGWLLRFVRLRCVLPVGEYDRWWLWFRRLFTPTPPLPPLPHLRTILLPLFCTATTCRLLHYLCTARTTFHLRLFTFLYIHALGRGDDSPMVD